MTFISTSPLFPDISPITSDICLPQLWMVLNIPLSFTGEYAGVSFALKFFHFGPAMENKWALNGSFFSS